VRVCIGNYVIVFFFLQVWPNGRYSEKVHLSSREFDKQNKKKVCFVLLFSCINLEIGASSAYMCMRWVNTKN
jgi:hypothetical protein